LSYFVNFTVAGQRYAMRSCDVHKVIRVVDIVPIPNSSEKISGTINKHGARVVIFNMQAIFTGSSREVELTDAIIVIRLKERKIGLLVDGISGIEERSEEDNIRYKEILLEERTPEGLSTFRDGTILISDVESFLAACTHDGIRSDGKFKNEKQFA